MCPPDRRIKALEDLLNPDSVVFFDQFGVLHDGYFAYPGAVACCRRLFGLGVPMAIISNSGKRAAQNRNRMAELGFDPDMFRLFLTSGELAHETLARMLEEGALSRGAHVLVLSRQGDQSTVEGLDLHVTEDPEVADLVLIAGVDAALGLDRYCTLLRPLARRRVPALCINPDLHSFLPNGVSFGPGKLARAYAASGGPVEIIGKPHPSIFESACARLGDVQPRCCIMVGDSPAHDIAGAAAMGMRTCLVAGGVFDQDEEAARRCPLPDFWLDALI